MKDIFYVVNNIHVQYLKNILQKIKTKMTTVYCNVQQNWTECIL